MQAVIETLLFYHPAVWWLSRRIREERENCCDDLAVAVCGDKRTYVEALLKLEQSRSPSSALAMASNGGDLVNRVARMLGQDQSRSTRTSFTTRSNWIVAAMAIAIVGTLLASSLANRHVVASPVVQEPDKSVQKPQEKEVRKIRIHVVAPDNSPIFGSKLFLNITGRDPVSNQVYVTNLDHKTDEDGVADFKLPDGMDDVRLSASAEGYTPLFTSWANERISQGELPVKEFTFQMIAAIEIGGVFVDESDRPIEGVVVEVRGSSRITIPNKQVRLSGSLAYGDTAVVSGADGKWSLSNVPPGDDVSITLRITHPDYISDGQEGEIQKSQSIGFKELRAKTAKIVLRKGVHVRGKISNEAGEPIPDALIIWGDYPYGQEGSQEMPVNADGSYEMPAQKHGELRITVIAPDYSPEMAMVDVAHDMPATDFVLSPGKRLEIRFVDEQGQPVPRVYVGIDRWRKAQSLYNNRHPNVRNTRIPGRSDDNGIYIWDWAPEDAVEYTFSSEDYHIQQNVSLTAGDNPIDIVMQRPRKITGTVTDLEDRPIKSFRVIPCLNSRNNIAIERRGESVVGEDGKFEIKIGGQEGNYSLKIEANGFETAVTEQFQRNSATGPFVLKLKPTVAVRYQFVTEDRKPIPDATIIAAPEDQVLSMHGYFNRTQTRQSRSAMTADDGSFTIPSSKVPRTILAISPDFYGEVAEYPNHPTPTVTAHKWGSLECFITKDGQPWQVRYMLKPIRYLNGHFMHIQVWQLGESAGDGRLKIKHIAAMPNVVQVSAKDQAHSLAYHLAFEPGPGEEFKIDFSNCTRFSASVSLTGSDTDKVDMSGSRFNLQRIEPSVGIPEELLEQIKQNGLDVLDFTAICKWFMEQDDWQGLLAYGSCFDGYGGTIDEFGKLSTDVLRPGKYLLNIIPYAKTNSNVEGIPLTDFSQTVEIGQQPADFGNLEVPIFDDPKAGSPVADFEYSERNGNLKSTLVAMRGKYLLLDCWTPSCNVCEQDTPRLRKLVNMLAAKGQTSVISLTSYDTGNTVRIPPEIPPGITWIDGQIPTDDASNIRRKLGAWTSQHFVLVDPEGNYVIGGSLAVVAGKMEELGLK